MNHKLPRRPERVCGGRGGQVSGGGAVGSHDHEITESVNIKAVNRICIVQCFLFFVFSVANLGTMESFYWCT